MYKVQIVTNQPYIHAIAPLWHSFGARRGKYNNGEFSPATLRTSICILGEKCLQKTLRSSDLSFFCFLCPVSPFTYDIPWTTFRFKINFTNVLTYNSQTKQLDPPHKADNTYCGRPTTYRVS